MGSDVAFRRVTLYADTPESLSLVAESEGEIIAFAQGSIEPYLCDEVFFLREFCVALSKQKQGVGSKLWQTLTIKLQEMGVGYINLLTKSGSMAEKFYKKCGCSVDDDFVLMFDKL